MQCNETNPCPGGYGCQAGQCIALDGQCECAPLHVELAAATDCATTNAFGSCAGTRSCKPAGLSACSAPAATLEVCDGVDNDCSGAADDLVVKACEITNQFGSCPGSAVCVGGVQQCQGDPPQGEKCDGFDNDCNGTIDDGFPNNDDDALADCVDTDDDNDGIVDTEDNCPTVPNFDQLNTDGDAKGNACDGDDDNDGFDDPLDCEPLLAFVHPTAIEECDGFDNDCDGGTDEKTCNDGNPCTDDVCDPVGGCSNDFNTAPCNDSNPCTQNDACSLGTCEGAFLNCNDGNPCTDDSCTPTQGCVNTPNALPCSDSNFCTEGDKCSGAVCLPGTLVQCGDDNPCTLDGCDPTVGCTSIFSEFPCDDGNPCTQGDACGGGFCGGLPKNCDDGNPCTNDSCSPSVPDGCIHGPASGPSCDDADPCTEGDICISGTCHGSEVPCGCANDAACAALDDGNPCTGELFCDGSELPAQCALVPGSVVECELPSGMCDQCATIACDPVTGNCVTGFWNEGGQCSDGDNCTTGDTCIGGFCTGVPQNCNDNNPCTLDTCDQVLGCVQSVPQTFITCDDKNACTANDTCSNGFCVGTLPVDCKDTNPCTNEVCVPAEGCIVTFNTSPCSDGNACTAQDACTQGTCNGVELDCDDDDACNGVETCDDATGCVDGVPLDCDDGIACTLDGCSDVDGCIHIVSDVACDDGAICNGEEYCHAVFGCLAGDAPPTGSACSDGDACTELDTCLQGECVGADVLCDDGDVCTDDVCNSESGCDYPPLDGTECDDGDGCTQGDLCVGGECASGDAVDCSELDTDCVEGTCDGGACVPVFLDVTCDDTDPCTEDDVCIDGVCGGASLDCSYLDVGCTVGVCDGGVCVGETVPCSVESVLLATPGGSVWMSGADGREIRGSAGHGGPTGTADGGEAHSVRFGFYGILAQ